MLIQEYVIIKKVLHKFIVNRETHQKKRLELLDKVKEKELLLMILVPNRMKNWQTLFQIVLRKKLLK